MDTVLPKRQRIKRQNRQFILDGARRVFAEQGYNAATVRDIIRAQLYGEIEMNSVASEDGGGTLVRVAVPLSARL